jgi:hypothetical protein
MATGEGDLARTTSIEPNSDFPDYVSIRLVWGRKAREVKISADQYFGRGVHGAPMPAEAFVQHIERLRRMGAPE